MTQCRNSIHPAVSPQYVRVTTEVTTSASNRILGLYDTKCRLAPGSPHEGGWGRCQGGGTGICWCNAPYSPSQQCTVIVRGKNLATSTRRPSLSYVLPTYKTSDKINQFLIVILIYIYIILLLICMPVSDINRKEINANVWFITRRRNVSAQYGCYL